MTDAPNPSPPKHTGGRLRQPRRQETGHSDPSGSSGSASGGVQVQPQPEVEQPINAGRKKDGTFAKGFVANPAGKPKGTRHNATRLAEALIDGRAKEIVDKAIEMALAGDPTAVRLVLDRLCPPRRERPVSLEMPSIKSATDLITAAAALTDATASGDITPSEAASLSTLVGNVAKAIETVEIVARLERIEEQLGTKGLNP
jgi:hypothetical protein